MSLKETTLVDYVAWTRRANARWIVHHDVGRNAESYLGHLAQADQRRLVPSCRNAYLMVWLRDAREDPKPWFYSGLFSLTTADEAEKFLANHWLTRIVTARPGEIPAIARESVGEITLEKIRRIQEAMARLPDPL